MTNRSVCCATASLAVLAVLLLSCDGWPTSIKSASSLTDDDADTTTAVPSTTESDIEATTLAAAIQKAITKPPPGVKEEPVMVYKNHTCYMKQIVWNIQRLATLKKCSTVAGSVVIALLEEGYSRVHNESMYDYSFPDLIEITGHLIIYKLEGVHSLAHMFPNLRVVRGVQLVHKFSVVIADNPQLQEIAFPSLTTIGRGYVIVRNNPLLCNVDSIDWDRITVQPATEEVGSHNAIQKSSPEECQNVTGCAHCPERSCWTPKYCQQYETGLNQYGNITCHPHCLGGCDNATEAGCFRCAGLQQNGTCVDSCPPHLFYSLHTHGCVNDYTCWKFNTIPLNGECLRECPTGTSHVVDPRKPYDFGHCYPCPDGRCLTVCECEKKVETISSSRDYRECQILNGSLLVRLSNENRDIREELLASFRSVEQILGSLEVHMSSVLPDLTFLRNLRLIDPKPDQLIGHKWSLRIWMNRQMTQLFDWNTQPALNVTNGQVEVADNPHLCAAAVKDFARHLTVAGANWTMADELVNSNGYEGICAHRPIDVQVFDVRPDRAQVRWQRFVAEPGYRMLGYWVHHRLAEDMMIDYGDDMDTCSDSAHWSIRFIPNDDDPDVAPPSASTGDGWLQTELGNLQHRQLYAYYVHAQVTLLNESHSDLAVHGLSPIRYFTSGTRRPLPPFVYTTAKTNTTINVTWFHPAWDTLRYVEYYIVDLHYLPDDINRLQDGRNYCLDPKVITPPRITKYANTSEPAYECCKKVLNGMHARFLTAHIGVDGDPDACGPDDHHCRSETEFHMLTSNQTWYSDRRNMDAIRAEELPLMMMAPPEQGNALQLANQPEIDVLESVNLLQSHYVDNTVHSFLFENLLSFERYAVRVYSCTNASKCGDYYQHFERTLRTLDADNIRLTVLANHLLPQELKLLVSTDRRPNGGVIVSYEVERYADTKLDLLQCVTGLEMERMHGRLKLYNFTLGPNLIRVRAITLGSTGKWFDLQLIVELPKTEPEESFWGTWIVSLAITATLACIMVFVYVTFTRNWTKRREAEAAARAAAAGLEMASVNVELAEKRSHLRRADSTDTLESRLSDNSDDEQPPPVEQPPLAAVADEPAGAVVPEVVDEEAALLQPAGGGGGEEPPRADGLGNRLRNLATRAVVNIMPKKEDKKRLISCDDAEELQEMMSTIDLSLGVEDIEEDNAGEAAAAAPPAAVRQPADNAAIPPAAAGARRDRPVAGRGLPASRLQGPNQRYPVGAQPPVAAQPLRDGAPPADNAPIPPASAAGAQPPVAAQPLPDGAPPAGNDPIASASAAGAQPSDASHPLPGGSPAPRNDPIPSTSAAGAQPAGPTSPAQKPKSKNGPPAPPTDDSRQMPSNVAAPSTSSAGAPSAAPAGPPTGGDQQPAGTVPEPRPPSRSTDFTMDID